MNITRLLLGVACFVLAALHPGMWPAAAVIALAVVFALSLALFLSKRIDNVVRARIALASDAAFFLLAVSFLPTGRLWYAAAFVFYLVATATIVHHWADVAVLTVVLAVTIAILQPPLTAVLLTVIPLLGLFGCLHAVQRKALLDRLSQSSRQVVRLRAEADVARDSERARIAADFHDGPLQSFISFQMRLEYVRKLLVRDTKAGLAELVELQDLCRSQVLELRSFVRGMRPLDPGSAGLVASLMRMAEDFRRESRMLVSFSVDDDSNLDDLEASAELLQVIREALINAQKHSSASRVQISLRRQENRLEFIVQDDGCGFPFSGAFTLVELDALRLGPNSIKTRVKSLKGDLLIDSKPGNGSRIELRIPV